MAKRNGGYLLGGRRFGEIAWFLADAVCGAEVQAAEVAWRGAGRRWINEGGLQRPAQAVRRGRGRRNGTLAGKSRLREAKSRCVQRPAGATAWAKGKRGMKAALPRWALLQAHQCGARWAVAAAVCGEMPRLKSACAARRGAKMKVQHEAVSGQPEAVLLSWCALVSRQRSERRA